MNKIRIELLDDAILIISQRIIKTQPFNEIISIQYDKPYVRIETISKCKNLLFTNLSEIKKFLPDYFIQISKSTIVNLKFASSIEKANGKYIIKLKDFPYIISRRRENTVVEYFKKKLHIN